MADDLVKLEDALQISNNVIESDKIADYIDNFSRLFFDIPFGNSNYQNKHFVAEAAITPERAYRAIGLKLQDRISALKSAYYNLRKEQIEIKKLMRRLQYEYDELERELIKIEIEEKLSNKPYMFKLINDCIVEIEYLFKLLKELNVKPNREEFEAAEEKYFAKKFERAASGITGVVESVKNMGYVLKKYPDNSISCYPDNDARLLFSKHKKIETETKDLIPPLFITLRQQFDEIVAKIEGSRETIPPDPLPEECYRLPDEEESSD